MDRYTVVLKEAPQNPDILEQLRLSLIGSLKLSETQAAQIAAKTSGTLLKPTTELRARQLAQLYTHLGIGVEVINLEAQTSPATRAPRRVVVAGPLMSQDPESHTTSTFVRPSSPSDIQANSSTLHPSVEFADVSSREHSTSKTFSSTLDPSDVYASDTPTRAARRFPLLYQILLVSMIPVFLLGSSVLLSIGSTLPQSLRGLIERSARQLAISVGANVKLDNFGALSNQLASLTEQPDVGFIQVNSTVAEQGQAKASLTNRLDSTVLRELNRYLSDAGTSSLSWRDDAEGYILLRNHALERSKGNLPALLEGAYLARFEDARTYYASDYQVVRVGVFEDDAGKRTYGEPDRDRAAFVVTVGMLANEGQSVVRRQRFILVASVLLVSLLTALLAVWSARRISRPILQLVRTAEAISVGQLERAVEKTRNDEVGDLAAALERMRVSLVVALERLRGRRSR